jgi:hypothetical protein
MAAAVNYPIIPGLSQEQTNVYYTNEIAARAAMAQLMNLCTTTLASLNTAYTAQMQAIFPSITGGTNQSFPNESNLAGAQSLNIGADVVAMFNLFSSVNTLVVTPTNTNLATRACGAVNLQGG